ncbi:uncharacterized protein LOC142598021 [Dermatophagoides farinae]|uniref:uncharacterized protein LOC142598021 n=1 Tax=Dermatophagoides farinae TaxID=6954 RepID=UPI003F617A2D
MSSNSPFGKLGLNSHICHVVKKFGIELPSPIQRKLIPAILNSNKNIIATARTGSGKTLAYLLPILHKLEAHSTIVGIRALIICPTRELVLQVSGVLKKLISFLSDFRICHLVGGMSLSKEFEHLLINPDIVIGTPGRLNYHITNTKIEFSRLEYLILDEADLLVDLNLEYEFNELSKSLKGLSIQRILVSATIPQKLLEFIKTEFDDPICVQLDESKRLNPNLSMNFPTNFKSLPNLEIEDLLVYSADKFMTQQRFIQNNKNDALSQNFNKLIYKEFLKNSPNSTLNEKSIFNSSRNRLTVGLRNNDKNSCLKLSFYTLTDFLVFRKLKIIN